MGILGFFQLSLYCFELFAWPVVALVYPLFASIRAIEANSNYHRKKLVTYWIIFSLISLVELTFAKPLEWFTIWPYMKLIAVCWLVMPRFGHAYNAYTSIIQMRSNAKMQCFVDWLIKQDKGKTVDTEENFLSVVKQFIKENSSEALEEVISNKPKVMKANADAKEKMCPVEAKVTENETRRAEFVKLIETNKTSIMPTPTNLSSSSDKVQWFCLVCQVTTSSEITLKSHLQDQRHILRCAELTAKKKTRKEVEMKETNKTPILPTPTKSSSSSDKVQKRWTCSVCQVTTSSEIMLKSHLQDQTHRHILRCAELIAKKQVCKEVEMKETNKTPLLPTSTNSSVSSDKVQKKWTCAVCQLTTSCEITLKSHLQGQIHRHILRCAELTANKQVCKEVEMEETNKTPILPTPTNSSSSSDKVQKQWTCAVCPVTTSNEITLKFHLQAQIHRHILRCAELSAKKQARKEKYSAEAKKNAANKNVSGDHSVNQSNSTRTPQEKRQCKICNVSRSGDLNFKSHLNGKKHLKKLQKLAASVTASQEWQP